jgi:hypothetical protein
MSTIESQGAARPAFSAQASVEGEAMLVRFSGTADLNARDQVETMLTRLHQDVGRLGTRQVVVDFSTLEFMNSSCFKSFVTWINAVQELPQERQYRIRFHSNPRILWQRRSMHALKCFAVNLIDVDV